MRVRRLGLIPLIAATATLGLAPAAAEAFVYWANTGGNGSASGTTIGRANNDGSGVDQGFVVGANEPCGVAVDGAHLYWANDPAFVGTTLGRANLDGTGVNQSFVSGASGPCFPTTDSTHLYWTNFGFSSVGRAPLNNPSGADQGFVTGAGSLTCGVAVNSSSVYFGNQVGNAVGHTTLADPNGPGKNPTFIAGANDVCGVAVNSAHVYWANFDGNSIGRANLDGSAPDQSFIDGAAKPCGVAVDDTHVYWANNFDGTIGRANLDGSSPVQNFVTGLPDFPCGVAVDALRRSSSLSVGCSPTGVAVSQPSTCTATVTDTHNGIPNPPGGTVAFSSAAGGHAFPGGSSCALSPVGTGHASCSVTYSSGLGANQILAFYAGDASHEESTGLGQVTVSTFSLGVVTINSRNGTATLAATVPGPGSLVLIGSGIVGSTLQAAGAGQVLIPVNPDTATRKRLKRKHQATVHAAVTFSPTGGGAAGAGDTSIMLVQKAKKGKKKGKRKG